jgi:hypothetical protein
MEDNNSTFYCNDCKTSYARKYLLSQHLKSRKHATRINHPPSLSSCACGKSYTHKNSLEYHKKTCDFKPSEITTTTPATIARNDGQTATEILLETMQHKLEVYEKEREAYKKEKEEMKAQIALLLDKHAGTTNINNTNNIIETQNINIININAFGNENTDYIDDKAILACIGRVYKSIPSLLEKLHFDPKHPENHNIKITNKKLPYASIMGNNHKWKTVDRKNAIEKMVTNSYNMLEEKYTENKDKFSTQKRENFEGFQSKFESDDKELLKQIKTEVDMMVLNGVV